MGRLSTTLAALALAACCKPSGGSSTDAPTAPATPASATPVAAPAAPPRLGPDGLPLEIPTTRSPAPSLQDWNDAVDLKIPSAPLGCEVNMIREWVRVNCSGKRRSGGAPDGVRVLGGCAQDTYTSMRSNANLVTALGRGRRCEVEFSWTDGKELFVAEWTRSGRPALGFQPAAAAPAASASGRPALRISIPGRR